MEEEKKLPIDYARAAIATMMRRFPLAADLPPKGHFHYHQGVFLSGVYENYRITGEESWFSYIKEWIDSVLDEEGRRKCFDEISLDDIQPGILLFPLYEKTGDPKYRKALELLMEELRKYAKNKEGGFWHKGVCQDEMWLDGLYMGGPISTMYGARFGEPSCIDASVEQALLMEEKTRDPQTGLLYHAYDCNRKAEWANPVTGLSPEFWGRSIGWVPVAVLDELDDVPEDHPKRGELERMVRELLTALCRYQGRDGRWYQVVDQADREGNWPENSCTCLYVAAICKAVQKGILEEEFLENAKKGYDGVIRSLKWQDSGTDDAQRSTQDGMQDCGMQDCGTGEGPDRAVQKELLLGEVCIGTGVGDYAHYCARPVSTNDLHGMGAFLLMCAQMQRIKT